MTLLPDWYNLGYTQSMKTAVSIPDDLFRRAESLTRRLGLTRSGLYSRALSAYLEQFDEQSIIDAVNKVCDANPGATQLDPVLERIQFDNIEREEW